MSICHPAAGPENFAALQQDPFFEPVVDLIADYLTDAFGDPADGGGDPVDASSGNRST